MFYKTLRDLARPQIVAIVDVLKRSDGLAVGDIADALKMSYMGVKQYCIELEKRGYVDTWRRAKETGRPELTYRLTPKAQVLFPQQSTELTMEVLEALRDLHGPTAVEKILYRYFLKKSDGYAKKMKGKSLVERTVSLAKLRDLEGHCVQVDQDSLHGLRLTEYHNPLADLMKAYPSVARMEESMISKLLNAPVHRDLSAVSGLMRITFLVAGASLPPPAPPSATARPRSKKPKTRAGAIEPETSGNNAEETTGLESAPGIEEFEPATHPPAAIEPAIEPAVLEPTAAGPAALGVDERGEPAATGQVDAPPEAAEVAVHCESNSATTSAEPAGRPAATKKVRVAVEAMLFDDVATAAPAPRPHNRAIAPARAAKPQATVAEELLLSL